MPDVLIRDVPAADLARIDAHATRLGLSPKPVLAGGCGWSRRVDHRTAADLQRFAARFAIGDPEIMRQAWS